jgi:hypothetical protein
MFSRELINSLGSITPIGLESIGGVRLMNRTETKYVFSAGKLSDLVNLLDGRYKVLEIENAKILPYHTTYFDTEDHLFYNQHVRGELERHKIRYRKYELSDTSFLEIKKRNNKNRTIKWRIENRQNNNSFDEPALFLIRNRLPVNPSLLKPVLYNRFNRITLIGLESHERITIDSSITFSEPENGMHAEMPFLAIVELKRAGHSHDSCFKSLIKQLDVHPSGFSKYCIGSAILNNSLKRNMVKPKLLLLKKIENEYISTYCN